MIKKRHSILAKKCSQTLVNFYECAAKIAGIKLTGKSGFDCRKIRITKPVQDAIVKYYMDKEHLTTEEIGVILLHFGPKANLDGDGYEFEVEPGFVSEMN